MLALELVAGTKTVSRSSPGHLSFSTCKSRVVICNHAQCWEGGRLGAMKCVTKGSDAVRQVSQCSFKL